MIWDPIAAQVAISGGVGSRLDIRLGGKMGPMSGDPLDLTVTGIAEEMIQEWPQQGDPMRIPCGDSVCLHCDGIDIIVGAILRSPPISLVRSPDSMRAWHWRRKSYPFVSFVDQSERRGVRDEE